MSTIYNNTTQQKESLVGEYPFEGGEELAVSGSIGAIGSDSSPTPSRGYSVSGAGSRSLPGVPVGGGDGTANYLEKVDNVSSWLDSTCDKGKGYFIVAECENGHRFAKELGCNKEWCEVCGQKDSFAHLRKFARWLPKAFQIKSMGYFVFTIPPDLRGKYRTKKALSELGHQVQQLLKAFGYSRGLRRWHWFGDKSSEWHPHLNCLVDGGYIEDDTLDDIKTAYASLLGAEMVDVWYHYYRSAGQKVHKLKYVTKATFLDYDWDIEMALELRGFRNMVVWGRGQWDEAPVWGLADLKGKAKAEVEGLDIEAINSLGAGVCPVCGKELTWGEALPIGLLNMVEKQPLGAGYYRLADLPPPWGLPADVKQRLYWMELLHRAEVQVAADRADREARIEAEYQAVFWQDILK